MIVFTLFSLFLVVFPLPVLADTAIPLGDDPQTEARLKALAHELRCLVCQNQTLADSNAPLAEDLRQEIREMITRGLSDREITEYLVSRYGDFVLYRPPLKGRTWFLWFGPFVLLLAGLAGLVVTIRRRQRRMKSTTYPDSEIREVEQWLRRTGDEP